MSKALSVLPAELTVKSISTREVVLPLVDALRAIEILETAGFHILGWEGWVKSTDGRVGHGSAGRYSSISLENLPPGEAANLTRQGIAEDAESWKAENVGATDALYFCITARLNKPLHPSAFGDG
jgi:hypothetical protein